MMTSQLQITHVPPSDIQNMKILHIYSNSKSFRKFNKNNNNEEILSRFTRRAKKHTFPCVPFEIEAISIYYQEINLRKYMRVTVPILRILPFIIDVSQNVPSGRLNCLQGAIKITLPCHSYISDIITYINLSSIQLNFFLPSPK